MEKFLMKFSLIVLIVFAVINLILTSVAKERDIGLPAEKIIENITLTCTLFITFGAIVLLLFINYAEQIPMLKVLIPSIILAVLGITSMIAQFIFVARYQSLKDYATAKTKPEYYYFWLTPEAWMTVFSGAIVGVTLSMIYFSLI